MKKSALVLSCILLLAFPMYSESAVSFSVPDECEIGQPFIAMISSDVAIKDVSVQWMKKKLSLEVLKQGEEYRAVALLGSSVQSVKYGVYQLKLIYTIDNSVKVKIFSIGLRFRKYPEDRLSVDSKMVTPPKEELPRIKKESALVAKAKNTISSKRIWSLPATRPVLGKVTSSYGFRRVYNGVPRGRHGGVDLRAGVGAAVKAIWGGKVILVGEHYFAGKSVYIDSGNGVVSGYFHLSEISIKQGSRIKAGQIIGKAGATGRVTGAHLHLSVFLCGQAVDPMPLFDVKFSKVL